VIAQIAQLLLSLTLILSCTLMLVLAIRIPLRRWDGAGLAYSAWLVVPLTLVVHLLINLLPIEEFKLLPTGLALPLLSAAATTNATPATMNYLNVSMLLWFIGAAFFAALLTFQQHRFVRSLGSLTVYERGRNMRVDIMRSAHGDAGPLVMGLLRPRIVLSSDFEQRYTIEEQRLVLAHECVHIRRGDLFANALTALLQVVFWFHPLLHRAARLMRLDQELSCDATVLAQTSTMPDRHRVYASAILKTVLVDDTSAVACHWQSRHPINERIMQFNATPPRRATRFAMRTVLATCTVAACCGAAANADRTLAPGPGQYRIEVVYTAHTVDPIAKISTRRSSFAMVQDAGKAAMFRPNGEGAPACEFAITATALPDDKVQLDIPMTCNGGIISHPKMVTQLGKLASFETTQGTAPASQTVHNLALIVTQ
jgi:bla regulator protein blaR1